jgi:septum formation protein
MFSKLEKYDIILASASPRRQELLTYLGLDFRVEVRPVDEDSFGAGMSAEEVALLLSKRKADAFSRDELLGDKLLITADTVVCLNGEILGKPGNREEGISMLRRLSSRMHQVITGVDIRTTERDTNFSVSTNVYFKELRQEEIEYYIDHFKPYDKAGAYGIQEWIGYIGIEKIEGSFYNVMGLPVLRLYEELLKF